MLPILGHFFEAAFLWRGYDEIHRIKTFGCKVSLGRGVPSFSQTKQDLTL